MVDYWSSSYQGWIAATVTAVEPTYGVLMLDVKPKAGMSLQDQKQLLRPRTRPGEHHLEWMHAVKCQGRVYDEAAAIFSKHAVHTGFADPPVVTQQCLPAVGLDVDAKLGVAGSVKYFILELQKTQRGALTEHMFASAFWDQLSWAYHTYKSEVVTHRECHRRESVHSVYGLNEGSLVHVLPSSEISHVRELRNPNPDARRVCKKLKRDRILLDSCMEDEIAALSMADHPNLFRLYEFFEDAQFMYLLTDLSYWGNTLEGQINFLRRIGKLSPIEWIAKILRQCLHAVKHIHSHGVVHLNLKSGNIGIMPSVQAGQQRLMPLPDHWWALCPHAVVMDLGAPQFTRLHNFRNNLPMGTPEITAPEVWAGEITPKADMYSMGCVLHEMLLNSLPFPWIPSDGPESAMRFHMSRPEVDFARMCSLSPDAGLLCSKMLDVNRHQRPTAHEALQDRFVDDGSDPCRGGR